MSIRILDTDLRVLPMRTRMPFRYGIATLTRLPHLFVRVDIEIDGQRIAGIAADGLAPKWFTKNPQTTTEHDIAEMIDVIETACGWARASAPALTVFELWQQVYAHQQAWGTSKTYPPLLWNFGVSLVERAMIDAFCRARNLPLATAIRDNALGIRLDAMYPELAGTEPVDLLPSRPLSSVIVRHTVGLSDPLEDREIAPEERLDDGLPQSLRACVDAYSLTHFKIKLCGDRDRDVERLRHIAAILATASPDYAFTLDGNEQFHDGASFRAMWQALADDPQVAPMLRRLLFVEQPLHRAVALDDATAQDFNAWDDRPPIIIDESDGEFGDLPRALRSGYAGTSHKNCKGIFKGIANACLLQQRRRVDPQRPTLLSGEDLANVGPVALLQDFALAATLGIEHVERNGHHYFAGLSMFEGEVQQQTLAHHGDLYRMHPRGFATLDVRAGRVSLNSVAQAPFGLAWRLDTDRYMPLSAWRSDMLEDE